jgi:hypothetical protein
MPWLTPEEIAGMGLPDGSRVHLDLAEGASIVNAMAEANQWMQSVKSHAHAPPVTGRAKRSFGNGSE